LRLSVPNISKNNYHPFTITSSPQDDHLSLHIRAVGPWTNALYELTDTDMLPNVFIDGPYGDIHDNWQQYSTVAFIAGGIGVTPFASILKSVLFRVKNIKENFENKLSKIHFYWVCQNQEQFEWFIDVLRELENEDYDKLIVSQTFITSTPTYDVRNMMLWLAEQSSRSIGSASIFTGLRGQTHFGKPNWRNLLKQIIVQKENKSDPLGVFVCSGAALSQQVKKNCDYLNSNSSKKQIDCYVETF